MAFPGGLSLQNSEDQPVEIELIQPTVGGDAGSEIVTETEDEGDEVVYSTKVQLQGIGRQGTFIKRAGKTKTPRHEQIEPQLIFEENN